MKKYLMIAVAMFSINTIQAEEINNQPQGLSLPAAMVAVPLTAYNEYMGRVQVTEALSLSSGQKAALAEYYANKKTCADNSVAAKAGAIALPEEINGKYTARVVVGSADQGSCRITAYMKDAGVSKELAGKTLTLTMLQPDPKTQRFEWKCSGDMGQKYLPASCRGS